jgi:hypothetical protein
MNNYLTRLAARSLGLAKTIKPRMPSVFEPVGMADWHLAEFNGRASSLESMDEIQQEVSGETSSDIQSSTNTRSREEKHSADHIRSITPQSEETSAVSNEESDSRNTSHGLAHRIEARDQSLSSPRSKIGEKIRKELHLRDIRSADTRPGSASLDAASSAAIKEEDAIGSQEERQSTRSNPIPTRLKIGEMARGKMHIKKIQPSGTSPASASRGASYSAANPGEDDIRSQDRRPSIAGLDIGLENLDIGEKARERSHGRKTQPTGPSPSIVSREASSPAAIPQEEVRSQDQDPSAAWANRSPDKLGMRENLHAGLHLRKIQSIESSKDRALNIHASSEAELANKIEIQDQRAENGLRLDERKQSTSLPSVTPSGIMEDDSISSPTPAASSPYENDLLPHLKNRRILNFRKTAESAGFSNRLTRKRIERKMPTSNIAKRDDYSASKIKTAPQHGFVSVHHKNVLKDSDSAAHKSEPRTPMKLFAEPLLKSAAQRYEKRAQIDNWENIKSQGERNNASTSTVYRANQTEISFNRRFPALDAARPNVNDEIDLERDFLGSGILNPDPRMVQVMMPPGPPAKRHENPKGRNFAGYDKGDSPEVHVTIGRIEVRAVTSQEAQKKRASPETVGLDEYLRERSGGKR